jgi:hypothetical protein
MANGICPGFLAGTETCDKLIDDEYWGPIIRDMMQVKICGRALTCGIELWDGLTLELPKCAPEFYEACDFDRLIRICPFDPAWDAFEWKQQVVAERLEALEVQVKELQAKVQRGK